MLRLFCDCAYAALAAPKRETATSKAAGTGQPAQGSRQGALLKRCLMDA